ncbi:alpha/beta hydrolase family protein [Undibacterium fentianense]|uniref:S9 family peptidase n=1 Tax=Undibacterium fentianense TaxID=2828728 RepID=A0A941DZX7_9BURK|nr:prolyl oligopeptidase family serine peptidase [Undibacterium fentianense]MBR7800634.1 S9 family peptidase [Undibacterium fentianense]
MPSVLFSRFWATCLVGLLIASSCNQQSLAFDNRYQLPPVELQTLVDAPRGPEFRLGPKNRTGLLVSIPGLPSIAEVAQPELKLAGLRIHAKMRAAVRSNFSDDLSLLDIASGKIRKVTGLPAKAKIADTAWSADEKWLAFSVWGRNGVELWLLDVRQAHAHKLISDRLNAVTSAGFSWLNGSDQLLVRLLPRSQKPAPRESLTPAGPHMQETRGGKLAQTRTYPDLLKSPYDADMLDWQLQSQLAVVQIDGSLRRFGPVMNLTKAQASPDGKWVLTTQIKRPYSYQLPIERFGQLIEVWGIDGKRLKTVTEVVMRERLPSSNDAVQAGPRNYGWRNDQAATLYWLEAQGGGDPDSNVRVHDILWQQAIPLNAPPQKLIELAWRFNQILWSSEHLALLTEIWGKTRETRTWKIQPGNPAAKPELLFSRRTEDQYSNPGTPLMELNQFGRSVIRLTSDEQSMFLIGTGASPEGDRPFLDRYYIPAEKTIRLWRSKAPYYEEVLGVMDDQGHQIITSREAADERPNLFLRNLAGNAPARALTNYPHPTPKFKGIQKRQIHYERDDGVILSATLYLPPGYDEKRDGPRPMLMWAYPREFKSAESASQISGSPYRFNRINVQGPQVMLARGYTVLDGFAMPIIGEGRREPNDTFIEQIKMNAQAAVDEVVRLGVADRHRIAIGGHSYGAFMAANLLAHTSLFKAGIARSGAYNRSLTPFGFQAEDRNYWKAFDTYQEMAPFNYADEIEAPLLLIHGEDDNNPGTFPMQSERMYQALQGLGTPARLVMLPYESHIYRARESLMHMLWEQDQWLNRFVKNAKPNAK